MNSATFSGFARIAIAAMALVLAIVAGLAVGNAINGRNPAGVQGGTTLSRVADTSFSLDALQQLQDIRDDAAAPAFVDYGLRHDLVRRGQAADFVPDYAEYVGQGSETNDGAPADVSMTDTFRLTGPSDVERPQLRGDAPEFVDYVDQARQRSAAASGTSSGYVDYVDQARQRSAGR